VDVKFLSGEFELTMDDKGRISLPSDLRNCLPGTALWLTKSIEKCVWVFPPEQWERVSERFMASVSLSLEKSSWVQHRFIVPARPVEIDKSGRIAVPPNLRNYAGLSKDCMICGVGKYIEIWSMDQYEKYNEENEPKSKVIMEELGPLSLLL
jgi:MraZ protein